MGTGKKRLRRNIRRKRVKRAIRTIRNYTLRQACWYSLCAWVLSVGSSKARHKHSSEEHTGTVRASSRQEAPQKRKPSLCGFDWDGKGWTLDTLQEFHSFLYKRLVTRRTLSAASKNKITIHYPHMKLH